MGDIIFKFWFIVFVRFLFSSLFFFFSNRFCALIFLKTTRPIFIKLSDMIDTNLNFKRNFIYFDSFISVLKYWFYSDFQRVGLSWDLFLNDWRYWIQTFRDWRRRIVNVSLDIYFCLTQRAPKLAWTLKLRFEKVISFLGFLNYLFPRKYFALTYWVNKVVFFFKISFNIKKRG